MRVCESSSGFAVNPSRFPPLIFCSSFASPPPTRCHSFFLFSRIQSLSHTCLRVSRYVSPSRRRLHAPPHLLLSETPLKGLPFNHRRGKECSGDEEDFSSSDRCRILSARPSPPPPPQTHLKASNQRSQTKEAAASRHGQSNTGFQSDAD